MASGARYPEEELVTPWSMTFEATIEPGPRPPDFSFPLWRSAHCSAMNVDGMFPFNCLLRGALVTALVAQRDLGALLALVGAEYRYRVGGIDVEGGALSRLGFAVVSGVQAAEMTRDQALADAVRAIRHAYPDRWEKVLGALVANSVQVTGTVPAEAFLEMNTLYDLSLHFQAATNFTSPVRIVHQLDLLALQSNFESRPHYEAVRKRRQEHPELNVFGRNRP